MSFVKANIGQDEDFNAAKEKALKLGAKRVEYIRHQMFICLSVCHILFDVYYLMKTPFFDNVQLLLKLKKK